MGDRGELFSITTFAQHGQKTYFFNIKENRLKDIYMTVAESLKSEEGSFSRNQIAIFKEDMAFFAVVLWQAQEHIKQDSQKKEQLLSSKEAVNKERNALKRAKEVYSEQPTSFNKEQMEMAEDALEWAKKNLVQSHSAVWQSCLVSKNKKRAYIFKIDYSSKGTILSITEEKTDNSDLTADSDKIRTLRVDEEDIDIFVTGYNKCRAYEFNGDADPNRPYVPKKKVLVKKRSVTILKTPIEE